MSEHQPSGLEPRARPVADLPLASLLERNEQLAKDWALALIGGRSLQHLDQVPLDQLARDAPALCEQTLRALGSASELARLIGDAQTGSRPGPVLARRAGTLAGAQDAAQAVLAVEALRGVLWEALLAELGSTAAGRPRSLTDASDRLAYVCATILPEAIAAVLEDQASAKPAEGQAVISGSHNVVASPRDTGSARADEGAHAADSPRAHSIKIIDEFDSDQPTVEPTPWHQRIAASAEPLPSAQIQIRDERGEEGPAAWIGSIGRQLERFEQDRLSFAVLLLELSHQPPFADLKAAGDHSLSDTLERALQQVLRDAGGSSPLTRERAGRYWLLAPRTDRSGAADLAERLSVAAKAAGAAQGVEVLVAVGTAVCPQDGSQASALAAHADIGLYAARSRSRSAAATSSLDERS